MNIFRIAFMTGLAGTAIPASATYYDLTNGTGDGQARVTLTETGYIGSGIYNPVGAKAPGQTIYGSSLLYSTGPRRAEVKGNAANVVLSADKRTLTSSFTVGSLAVELTQSLVDLVENGRQTGSQLQQSYRFTNLTAQVTTLDLLRYLDGDLNFDNNRADGGGRAQSNGTTVLFETDGAGPLSAPDTFLGIYNQGGVETGFDVVGSDLASWFSGRALSNTVRNDTNGDGVVDSPFDVSLALGSRLTLAASGSGNFTTNTIFGSGAPGTVTVQPTGAVPEPASWAMMVFGFGAVGGAIRRRGAKSRSVSA